MPETASNLAFIIGHYKAGSTWLLNMLSLHPDVRGLRETHAFHHVRKSPDASTCTERLFTGVPFSQGGPGKLVQHQLTQAFAPILKRWKPPLSLRRHDRPAGLLDLPAGTRRRLAKELPALPLGNDYLRHFFGELWQGFGEPGCLLEKTPRNIGFLADVREAFPEAKLLAVYRDGRDVAVSSRAFRSEYKGSREKTLASEATAWRDAMQVHLEAVESGDLISVAYEQLQVDPQQALALVLDAMGLAADDALVAHMVSHSSFEFRTGRARGEEAKGRFDRKGVAGDWVNHFDADDKAIFKEIAGELLVRLGYERDHSW
ncbi:MAG: sulfotransferase [Pseudomonadota bacterium]